MIDTLSPDLRIGTESGRPEEAFGNVADVKVGADGTIWVLDAPAGAVRVFGPGGEFLRSLGRRGDGPGEFRTPRQMTLAPDGTLWVYDEGVRAVLVLAPDGTEVARHETRSSGPAGGPLSFLWDGAFARDGKLVQSIQHTDPLPTGAMGLLETPIRAFVRTLDPATGAVDSVPIGEEPFRRYRFQSTGPGGGMGVTMGVVPFDPRRLVAVDREGSIWTALSTDYALHRTSPAGDTLVVRVDLEGRPPGADERAAWERLRDAQVEFDFSERTHVLWRLFTDDEDRLWVQRAAGFEPTGHFDVFRSDGGLVGSVLLPGPGRLASFATSVRGGNLYAVTYDDLGVARVIRAPLPALR